MPDRKDLTPSEVVTEVLRALDENRWNDVAQYVDPLDLRELLDMELQSARGFGEGRITTAAEHQKHNPEMPIEVAQWYEDQARKHAPGTTDELLRHFGVSDVHDLAKLPTGEQFGTLLRARDQNNALRFEAIRVAPDVAPFLPDLAMPHHRVIGELVEGELAHVVFATSPRGESVMTLTLKRSPAGWGVFSRNPLFQQGSFGFMGNDLVGGLPRPRSLAMSQMRWTARVFDHKLSPELLPALLERFRGTPARVSELLQAAPTRTLIARPNGKWSIQEHLGHLFDLEELGERRLADYQNKAAVLTAADMSNRKTKEANHNEARLWELENNFREARAALVEKLGALPQDVIAHVAQHPRMQRPMNVVDWMFFMCEHDDHHLAAMRAQMIELTQELWDEVYR